MVPETIQGKSDHGRYRSDLEMASIGKGPLTMVRATVSTELGTEIQCARCEEFWPCDPEFFFFSKNKPHSWCKACYVNDPKTIAKRVRLQQAEKAKRKGLARLDPTPIQPEPVFNATPLQEALWRGLSNSFNFREVVQ